MVCCVLSVPLTSHIQPSVSSTHSSTRCYVAYSVGPSSSYCTYQCHTHSFTRWHVVYWSDVLSLALSIKSMVCYKLSILCLCCRCVSMCLDQCACSCDMLSADQMHPLSVALFMSWCAPYTCFNQTVHGWTCVYIVLHTVAVFCACHTIWGYIIFIMYLWLGVPILLLSRSCICYE